MLSCRTASRSANGCIPGAVHDRAGLLAWRVISSSRHKSILSLSGGILAFKSEGEKQLECAIHLNPPESFWRLNIKALIVLFVDIGYPRVL